MTLFFIKLYVFSIVECAKQIEEQQLKNANFKKKGTNELSIPFSRAAKHMKSKKFMHYRYSRDIERRTHLTESNTEENINSTDIPNEQIEEKMKQSKYTDKACSSGTNKKVVEDDDFYKSKYVSDPDDTYPLDIHSVVIRSYNNSNFEKKECVKKSAPLHEHVYNSILPVINSESSSKIDSTNFDNSVIVEETEIEREWDFDLLDESIEDELLFQEDIPDFTSIKKPICSIIPTTPSPDFDKREKEKLLKKCEEIRNEQIKKNESTNKFRVSTDDIGVSISNLFNKFTDLTKELADSVYTVEMAGNKIIEESKQILAKRETTTMKMEEDLGSENNLTTNKKSGKKRRKKKKKITEKCSISTDVITEEYTHQNEEDRIDHKTFDEDTDSRETDCAMDTSDIKQELCERMNYLCHYYRIDESLNMYIGECNYEYAIEEIINRSLEGMQYNYYYTNSYYLQKFCYRVDNYVSSTHKSILSCKNNIDLIDSVEVFRLYLSFFDLLYSSCIKLDKIRIKEMIKYKRKKIDKVLTQSPSKIFHSLLKTSQPFISFSINELTPDMHLILDVLKCILMPEKMDYDEKIKELNESVDEINKHFVELQTTVYLLRKFIISIEYMEEIDFLMQYKIERDHFLSDLNFFMDKINRLYITLREHLEESFEGPHEFLYCFYYHFFMILCKKLIIEIDQDINSSIRPHDFSAFIFNFYSTSINILHNTGHIFNIIKTNDLTVIPKFLLIFMIYCKFQIFRTLALYLEQNIQSILNILDIHYTYYGKPVDVEPFQRMLYHLSCAFESIYMGMNIHWIFKRKSQILNQTERIHETINQINTKVLHIQSVIDKFHKEDILIEDDRTECEKLLEQVKTLFHVALALIE